MSTNVKYTVALTGATGFLGGHVLQALIEAGYIVRALTRQEQPSQANVTWIKGSLSDPASLAALAKQADCMIHLAGLTKAKNRSTFFAVNRDGTDRVLKAAADANVKRFLLISSLAAREPHLSHYAASKAAAEGLVLNREWPFESLVLRPPAIYGPNDYEILKIIKATKFGVLPAPGGRKNRFSMIHVRDLADAIVAAISMKKFTQPMPMEIDDGTETGYSIENVADAIASLEENKKITTIPIPYFVLSGLGAVNLLLANVAQFAPMLTPAKAKELCHDDWTVNEASRFYPSGWHPKFNLPNGLKNTIEWYRQNDLL